MNVLKKEPLCTDDNSQHLYGLKIGNKNKIIKNQYKYKGICYEKNKFCFNNFITTNLVVAVKITIRTKELKADLKETT
ncbi:hypothetical protein [Borrelia hermsii]|uniref:hypothetical protein n=1 Tax=Borrelia hermsii TaxID=140 RepID=UPI0013966E61